MLLGEEGTNYTTYKNWDPANSYVSFTYTDYTPTPSITSPVSNQKFADPQISLTSTAHANPNSGSPLRYNFCVSSTPGCGSTVIMSGDITANQWTVPDGVLQDGVTYYAQVRALDSDGGGGYSGYSAAVPFMIDLRRGKDKTQSFDTVGPVSIDLATGNLSTSNSSHTSGALGGSMGVSVDYNSPLRSRSGLVGQYYANNNLTGDPALTRVDQQINFDWSNGSPSSTLPVDNFSARWSGYFVAPKAGNYQFGARADDGARIKVNNQEVLNNWTPTTYQTPAYGSAVTLTEGQVVPISIDYYELGGAAASQLFVKGAVNEQIVPKDWLQTGVRPLQQQNGLTGRYYNYDAARDLDAANKTNFLTRVDPLLSMDWGANSPVAGGANDFMVRWTGYVTLPTSGVYQFGANADDGVRVKIDGNTVMDNWNVTCCSLTYGGGTQLSAGTHSITVDMYDWGGGAKMFLYAKGAVAEQVVPSSWLTTKAQVLPDGWNLGIDPDGELSYDRLTVNGNSVTLADSTGDTHEYTWTGSGYKPPVNEDGYLVRNNDGSFTLNDDDGKTYVFSTAGVLTSVTLPVDDRSPAALSYSYSGSPAKIKQIKDGVDASRNATVYYGGDSECGGAPGGFDTSAPDGMLCAVKTNDGRTTYFYYLGKNLARIVKPGNETTDYQYDSLGRIVAVRDSVANDAINANKRNNDSSVLTQLSYDELGRATAVTAPAATAGATRQQQTIEYLPGNGTYAGATQQHISGDAEPNGFSRRVEYDTLFRTTRDTDVTNNSTVQEWDAAKDLLLSSTDATGLKSTTLYDADDRPTDSYGPAPAAWFGSDRKPLAANTAQTPRSSTGYDENISGVAVAWHKLNASGGLDGAPVAHSTGVNPTVDSNWLGRNFTNTPLPAGYGITGDYGFSATGKITFPQSGTYIMKLYHDDGARVWIDDQLLFDNWSNRSEGTSNLLVPQNSFTATAGKTYRFRFDYAHVGNPGVFELWTSGPGISEPANGNWTSKPAFIKPGYSLQTSSTTYDAQLGNSTSRTNYGSTPELGLAQSTSVDANNLNLTATSTYEAQGAGGFLRQLGSSLPGGATTSYAYYAVKKADGTPADLTTNPCDTSKAYKQGGQLRLKTDPNGRTTETVYDDSGAVVATRYNEEAWTCTSYDTRGRASLTTIPTYNGQPGRTVSNDYAVGGNPLVTSTTDPNGTITVENDLLGRNVKYTDVRSDVTTSSYDNKGRLVNRVSKLGTEDYVYDQFDRLTQQKLDNVTYATVSYDQFSRISNVAYQNGASLSNIGRDTLGRVNNLTYGVNGQTLSDQVVRATTGDIVSGTELGQSKSYQYDGAGRLTNATVAGNTYTYGYGTQSSSCAGSTNAISGKSSNRTSQTVNGATTTYCYNNGDQLVSSSNSAVDSAQYDSHGNTTGLGSVGNVTSFTYDSSDRLTNMTEPGKDIAVAYARDVQGRVISRSETKNTNTQTALYGYTASGDTPDYLTDGAGTVTEKYLSLPGNVTLTIRPQSQSAGAQTWSLPNIHGDNFATVNADGGLVNTTATGPFGEAITSQAVLNNLTGSASYGYVGQHQKQTETGLTLQPMDMGARTYIPDLGRFLQMDPVKGGTPNDYVYASDPVNEYDLTGKFIPAVIMGAIYVGGIAWSAYDVKNNPSSTNKGMLAVAFIPGLGTTSKAGKVGQVGYRISGHAAKQMAERKITIKAAGRTVDNGVRINYFERGVRKAGYYDSQSRLFVATRGKKIITAINKAKKQYINNVARRGK